MRIYFSDSLVLGARGSRDVVRGRPSADERSRAEKSDKQNVGV